MLPMCCVTPGLVFRSEDVLAVVLCHVLQEVPDDW